MPVRIRAIEENDLPELTRIYNHYVLETPITFDIETFTLEERRKSWYEGFSREGRYHCFVAEVDGRAAGWASGSRFRTKAAYDSSVETTIYLDPEITGSGVGTQLYRTLIASVTETGFHRALAGVTLPNDPSVALHERFGFTKIGVFGEVGHKLGRYWDVQWFEKVLNR